MTKIIPLLLYGSGIFEGQQIKPNLYLFLLRLRKKQMKLSLLIWTRKHWKTSLEYMESQMNT